jgi:hypothetical protein
MAHSLDVIRSVLVDLLVIGAVLAVPIVLVMVWRVGRRRQLVVTELLNSTGQSDLDGVTRGLTQLARQRIDAELLIVSAGRERLYKALWEAGSDRPESGRVGRLRRYGGHGQAAPGRVQQQFNDQLDQLLTATREAAPKQTQAAVQFLSVLVSRPRGLLVSGLLQCRGTASLQWGVSFDVLRVDTNRSVASETFWEPVAPAAADSDAEQTQPDSPRSAGRTERILALLAPAGRWVAIQLVMQSVFPGGARGGEKGMDRLLSGMLYSRSTGGYPGFGPFFQRLALTELRDAAKVLDLPIRLAALADTLNLLAASAQDAVPGASNSAEIYQEAHVQYARALRAMAASSTAADPLIQRYRVLQAISWLTSELPEPQRAAFRWLEEGGPDLTRQLPPDDLYNAAGLYALAARISSDRQLGERAVLLLRQALTFDAETPDPKLWAQADSAGQLAGVPIEALTEGLSSEARVPAPLSPDKLDRIIDQMLAAGRNHNT